MPTCEIVFGDRRLGVVRREDCYTVSGVFLWREKEIIKFKSQHFTGIFNEDEIHLKIYDY